MDIYELMKQVNEWVKEILQDNYVGVYFHGSLRLGSFNPNKSDLDFIIVVKEKINSETKQFIWDKMLENEQLFPKKGFEFSVVLEDNCRNIKHPIPYELHGSRDWIERYKEDKTIVINDDYKVDPDLASHFNVINVPNDKMDFGKPSKEVFSKVPKEYIIDCNGVQREHNKKLNNGLPILHKVPPKRDYGRYFCIMAEKGGTSHGGLTEKLSPFFHAKKQEVNAYGR